MARTRRHRAGRRRSRRAGKRRSRRAGTRKSRRRGGRRSVPWKGWGKIAPQGHARTVMLRKCGRKCFLWALERVSQCVPRELVKLTKRVFMRPILELGSGEKSAALTRVALVHAIPRESIVESLVVPEPC